MRSRVVRRALGIAGAVALLAPAAATADPVVPVMNADGGIFWRSAPDWSSAVRDPGNGVYPGTSVAVACFRPGTDVPGSANTMWVRASWAGGPGRGSGWINEHFLDDGAAINQPTPGVPSCDDAPVVRPAVAQPATPTYPSVWVGAPLAATWPSASGCAGGGGVFPSATCSLPAAHWWLARAPQGDWAADLAAGAGQDVRLYVAPKNATSVSTRVDAVGPACGSGGVDAGGYLVTVGITANGRKIGSVTYAHVNPAVRQGDTIGRWGTRIGTVWSRQGATRCWDGAHVHFQAYNVKRYSCFNRGWRPGQAMRPTNFIGFVGGSYVTGPRQACP